MPHAEYDVARPRSNITTSRSGHRFFACDAALPPAASPPITTTRLPTSPDARGPGARSPVHDRAAPGLASVHDRPAASRSAPTVTVTVARGPRAAARAGPLPRAGSRRPVGSAAVRAPARLTPPGARPASPPRAYLPALIMGLLLRAAACPR